MAHHDWADRKNEVVILGAGFSRAIGEAMPLADELGIMIVNELAEEVGRYLGTNGFGPDRSFESWLSLLANEVPYLGETDNLRLRACFSAVRDAIGRIIVEREQQVARALPSWLAELLSVWSRREATVITFNYDTLVERACHTFGVPWAPGQVPVSGSTTVLTQQELPGRLLHVAAPQGFTLLKLHGSVNWSRVPGDLSDATLREEPISDASASAGENRDSRWKDLSRERFLIPPLLAKSSWFSSPRIHHLWRQAYEALSSADRLTLIGYSLPAADWVSVEMLDAALRGRPEEVRVDVVNPDPKLRKRLEELVDYQAEVVHCEQVTTYVERVINEEAERVVRDLDDAWPRHRTCSDVFFGVNGGTRPTPWVRAWELSGKDFVFHLVPEKTALGQLIPSEDLATSLSDCDRIVIACDRGRFVVTDASLARSGPGDSWRLDLVAPAFRAYQGSGDH